MNEIKIWAFIALLFPFVVVKFTLFSIITLVYGLIRHIKLRGFTDLDVHFRCTFAALGQLWHKYVFFWENGDE